MTGVSRGGDAGDPGDLRDAFERRKTELREMADQVAAIRAAGDLIEEAKQFSAEAAKLRTELAERLRDAEHLSIAQLAERIGIKKGTAQILLEREIRAQRPKRQRVRRPPTDP
jgi:hypothetical protein